LGFRVGVWTRPVSAPTATPGRNTWGLGFRVRDFGFGVRELGFGVWDLVFGVWCLVFGV
jgi:hypothetical protein